VSIKKVSSRLLSLFLFACLAISQHVLAAPELEKNEFWDVRNEQSKDVVDHSAWQEILDVYLNDQHASGVNRFDYKAVSKADVKKLSGYLDYLQALKPRGLNKSRRRKNQLR